MAAYALEAGPKSPRLQLNVDNLLDKKYPTDATRGISAASCRSHFKNMRKAFVVLHRYVGLAVAALLVVEGITGSALAFTSQVEAVLSPALFASPRASPRLGLGTLARRAEDVVPNGHVDYLFNDPSRIEVHMRTREGAKQPLAFDELFLNPWTEAELGRRRYGDLAEGAVNAMPFVYRIHYELVAGPDRDDAVRRRRHPVDDRLFCFRLSHVATNAA